MSIKFTEDQICAISTAVGNYFKRNPEIEQEYKTYWRLRELNRALTAYEAVVMDAVLAAIDMYYDKLNIPEEEKAHAAVEDLVKSGLSQEDAVAQVIKNYDEKSYDAE